MGETVNTPRPGDEHRRHVDERAFQAVREAVSALQEAKVEYVLIGGWAVYTYGSKVPSIDTDLLIAQVDASTAFATLEKKGLEVGPGRRIELLPLDGKNHVLGPDFEMGDPDASYEPRELLRGRTQRMPLELPDGPIEVVVPEPPELCFTKLKAFGDRSLAWRAIRDPGVMARLHPTDRTQIREYTQGYYLRKAGKDLYDIALLEAKREALQPAFVIRRSLGLEEWVVPDGLRVERQLVEFALDLAEGDRDTKRVIRNLQNG